MAADPNKDLKMHKLIRNHMKDLFQLVRNSIGTDLFDRLIEDDHVLRYTEFKDFSETKALKEHLDAVGLEIDKTLLLMEREGESLFSQEDLQSRFQREAKLTEQYVALDPETALSFLQEMVKTFSETH